MNPQQPASQAGALPLSYGHRNGVMVTYQLLVDNRLTSMVLWHRFVMSKSNSSSSKGLFILVLFLLAALGGSIYTKGFVEVPFLGSKGASAEDLEVAKQAAQGFINDTLMQGQGTAEIKNVSEESGLYKLTVDVSGREINSYMTKDLATFFPSPLEMKGSEEGDAETGAPSDQPEPQEIPKSEKPTVQIFTMAFCPYGNQAEGLMKPVVDLLADVVDVEVRYIFYENYRGGGPDYCMDDESKYCSMHGVAEANQDIREICVYNNQPDKFWDFVSKINEDCKAADVETCWKGAAQAVGVTAASVESCFEANKLAYAKEEKELADKFGVRGSPTLIINEVKYRGARTSEGYKKAICGAFETEPEACAQVLGEDDSQAPAGGCGT